MSPLTEFAFIKAAVLSSKEGGAALKAISCNREHRNAVYTVILYAAILCNSEYAAVLQQKATKLHISFHSNDLTMIICMPNIS